MNKSRVGEHSSDALPSNEAVRFYQEHGYYIANNLFPDYMLDAAAAAIERFYRGERDRAPPAGAGSGWKPEDGTQVIRKNDFASLQLEALGALVRYPSLGAVAARLAGESVRLFADQLLYKPCDGPETQANVGWHTDRQYWRCCTSTEMLTAWIPFGDYGEKDGTLTVIDGSHRWSENNDSLDFVKLNFRSQNLDQLAGWFDAPHRQVVKVPLEMMRGHVSFHHCKTIHGSGPNYGPLPRIALAVHMQGVSNRWCEYVYRMPDGSIQKHELEIMCRKVGGVPDFADPAICPEL
jgi:hypothetical protein